MIIALELAKACFENADIRYQMIGEDTMKLMFRDLTNMGEIEMRIQFDENDTAFISYYCPFPVPEENMDRFYMLCSELNKNNRFLKFYMGEDRLIHAVIDIFAASEDDGETIVTFAYMMPSMVDKAFPVLMEELWYGRAGLEDFYGEES